MNAERSRDLVNRIACGILLLSAAAATGCQVSVGGQTLPSPYYHKDDVQYYAPGSEFKLPREAAALKEYAAERKLQQR
ncbi:MAG: hypothetical protein RIS70_1276 [Planctomycetota bacterium]|jgi:hypothetical protein